MIPAPPGPGPPSSRGWPQAPDCFLILLIPRTPQGDRDCRPAASGALAGSQVIAYVWLTTLESAVVGFEPGAGFLAIRTQDVAVIGLHCGFEHRAAMTPVWLHAFLHEDRICFPVAMDMPGARGTLPQTMEAHALEGTPTLLLIDREGCLRARHFGTVPDLALGAEIMALVQESADAG